MSSTVTAARLDRVLGTAERVGHRVPHPFEPVFGVVWVAVLAVFYVTGTDGGPGMPIHLPT